MVLINSISSTTEFKSFSLKITLWKTKYFMHFGLEMPMNSMSCKLDILHPTLQILLKFFLWLHSASAGGLAHTRRWANCCYHGGHSRCGSRWGRGRGDGVIRYRRLGRRRGSHQRHDNGSQLVVKCTELFIITFIELHSLREPDDT